MSSLRPTGAPAPELVPRPGPDDPATASRRPMRKATRRRTTLCTSRSGNEAHGDGSASWCGHQVPVGALVGDRLLRRRLAGRGLPGRLGRLDEQVDRVLVAGAAVLDARDPLAA